jgi:hypothetical protein
MALLSFRRVALLAGFASCSPLLAQYESTFEPPNYSGSAAGISVVGQDAWYTPSGSGVTRDGRIYTHGDDALSIPPHPGGASQFIGGVGVSSPPGSGTRAQHDIAISADAIWTFGYDLALKPGTLILGSFSTAPTTSRAFAATAIDMPGSFWSAAYFVFHADGTRFDDDQSPGGAFDQLLYDRWYRQTSRWNASTNQIEDVSITDLTTMVTIAADVRPFGWYAAGGANTSLPPPSAIRLFVGNSASNVIGWDNISVVPEPAAAMSALLFVILAARLRSSAPFNRV